MAVRRLASEQPASFEFTPENLAWAKGKITDYPEGRQASAVIPILWKAQEQHDGWLPEPAIRLVADMLSMPYIRVFEIATFYTMFQLQPVGKVAHIGVCGTTPCMLRGAQDIVGVCKKRIAGHPFELSNDGKFSWEEVECAGACVNAPMVQIGSDTFEDLTPESFEALLDALARGETPTPGPQSARKASEPISGATTLLGEQRRPKPSTGEAPGDAAPDQGVSPASPAAHREQAGVPSGSDRPEVEATRSSDEPASEPSPAAPEAKTNGRVAETPEEAAKQKPADASDVKPDHAAVGTGAPVERTTTAANDDEIELSPPSDDEAEKDAADRAAPGAEFAAEPEEAPAETKPEEAAAPAEAPTEAKTEDAAAPEAPAEPKPEEAAAPEAPVEAKPEEAAAPEAPVEPKPEAAAAPEAPIEPKPEEAAAPEAPVEAKPEEAAAPEAPAEPKPEEAAAPETPVEPKPEEAAAPEAPVEPKPEEAAAPEAPVEPKPEEAAAPAETPAAAEPAPTMPAPPDRVAAKRADAAGVRPHGVMADTVEASDDLKTISGVGPVIEKTLNRLGIFTFAQIAGWTQENKDWVNAYLAFKGRIDRERWVEQAAEFANRSDAS
ncbi:NADH-quinone oxidoreductase subunit NuoE [Acuticoccus sp. M5D2P5]|uniref:NADH-quinone oxidoreductase subunit NuoE n=1 Tax=Acuticoccus kalidii TaxID=2910977 RepID=UPI001F3820CC|nr:NADH-quinone oxidoreductase subunit NuoE [Acuticoccus kalidii]MCF3935104.1 NADH-quinone oxidoreductase subunit NuoE [Acuticoccus kalidii]